MAINLAKKADPKVLERFKQGSVTEGIFSNRYNWTGVATVQVYSVDTVALGNYNKALTSGSRFGALTELGDTMQEMTVSQDKAFNISIDKGNNTAQLMIKSAASVLRRETDEVIIPYVDKYNIGVFNTGAGLLYLPTASITKANIIETIMTANAKMSNMNVPKSDRVCYIGETLAIQAKIATEVIAVEKVGAKPLVNGVLGTIDGLQIRVVPDSYMPTGAAFIIVRKGAAAAPKKIETYRILEEHPDVDGAVVQGRLLHDCFVFDTNADAVLVCSVVASASGGGYAYERVINPTGNPYSLGYFTRTANTNAMTAVPSTETTVVTGHVYYKKLS